MHLLAAAAVDEASTSSSSSPPATRRRARESSDSATERIKAKRARKDLEKRGRASLVVRQREARRLPRSLQDKKKTETPKEAPTKEPASKNKTADVSPREQATEERKKKREEKVALQNKLAAEERERKRRQDVERRELKKQEAEKIAETKNAEKERKEEIIADKLKTVAHEASLQNVSPPTYTELMNKATEAGEEAAEMEQEAKESGKITATDQDVLLGRGGATNAHVGNKNFRVLVLKMQPEYISLRSRAKKSSMSKAIVEQVHQSGGRFLKEVDGEWTEVSEDVAQKKASQALRENAKELKQMHAANAAAAAPSVEPARD